MNHLRLRVLAPVIFGVVLLGTSLGLASSGVFGTFSDTGVSSASVDAGTVKLSWNETATAQLDTTVGPLEPADSVQFVSDLSNSGALNLSTIQIAVAGTNTGPISDGLQLAIDSCTVPWAGNTPNFTCGAVAKIVSVDRPVTGLINLPGSDALTPGGVDHLRFTYRLADSAPASMANTTGHVTIIATGIQRAGQTK